MILPFETIHSKKTFLYSILVKKWYFFVKCVDTFRIA